MSRRDRALSHRTFRGYVCVAHSLEEQLGAVAPQLQQLTAKDQELAQQLHDRTARDKALREQLVAAISTATGPAAPADADTSALLTELLAAYKSELQLQPQQFRAFRSQAGLMRV